MDENNIEEIEIDLLELFKIIWRKKFIIISFVLLAIMVTYFFANRIPPEFQSSTKILVSEDEEQLREYISEGNTLVFERNTDVYMEIMRSSSFLERMKNNLDLDPYSYISLSTNKLRNLINISTGSVNNIIIIEVKNEDPELATDIANKTADTLVESTYDRQVADYDNALNFISQQLETNQKVINQLDVLINRAEDEGLSSIIINEIDSDEREDLLNNLNYNFTNLNNELSIEFLKSEKEIAQNTYDMLRERQEEIRLQKNIQSNRIEIIEKATVPEQPISPRVRLMTLISGVLAGMVGLFFIFIIEFFDTRIKSDDQLEKVTDLPVLGIIPDIDKDKTKKNDKGDK